MKKQQSFDSGGQKPEEKTKSRPHYEQDQQGHALKHWCYHMVERRRQQNFISSESVKFHTVTVQFQWTTENLPCSTRTCRVAVFDKAKITHIK